MTSTIKITAITKYRALFLVLAAEQGWSYTQVSTNGDVFTKGTEAIHMVWGATQLQGFTHTKGKSLVAEAKGEVQGKLQRAQSQMGKPMETTKKWPKLSPSKVTELEALATKTFKVLEPKG